MVEILAYFDYSLKKTAIVCGIRASVHIQNLENSVNAWHIHLPSFLGGGGGNLTAEGLGFHTQQLVLVQHEGVLQARIALARLGAKPEPVSNPKVYSLPHAEAVGEAAVVAAREGHDILPRVLHRPAHRHTCKRPILVRRSWRTRNLGSLLLQISQ